MKILNLAIANIRKSKSATVSLFIFILIAALLLNIGLMVITQINPFYDHQVERLHDPHVTVVMDRASYDPTYEEFMKTYPGVEEIEIEELFALDMATFDYGDSELTSGVLLFNADRQRTIGPLHFVEKITTSSNRDIFLPYSFKNKGGYQLGDPFTLTYHSNKYEYRIAGFFETTTMGTTNIGVIKFMLSEPAYQTLASELDHQSEGVLLSAVMEDQTQSPTLQNDLVQKIKQSLAGGNAYVWGLDAELVKSVSAMTVNIVATLLVAFAAIIVFVSLIVIRFRVSNSIEDGMTNIGALKAIGYTSGQILSSILLQFILIALCSSVAGIALSYVLMPFIGSIITTLTGLIWTQSLDLTINLVSILLVVLCIVIVTLLSGLRVRKILPIAALRGGIQTHSFRKNYFPLEKGKSGLHFSLAMKSMVTNAKQNLMVLFIIIALTFASIFSVVLYYNIAADKTAFVNLFGDEPANVMVVVQSDMDIRELLGDIERMNHVRKVNLFDRAEMNVDGQRVFTTVTEEYHQLENNIVYEGRQPKHENEISISWVVSDQINKGIGDRVEVEFGAETATFIVTGLSQAIGNLGQVSALTLDGIQQLQSDYKGYVLYVYLDGISNKDFIKNVEEQYGDRIMETLDINENIESQTGMYIVAVFAVMLMVLIITVLVVGLILYLVIKTMIIKRRQELGIMKAIGYSTTQLMNQISMSFLPVIFTGVVTGGLLGYFFTNPMLSVLLSAAGVKRLDFIIQFPMILMICAGIFILAYIVSIVVSSRIKKISAYDLITE